MSTAKRLAISELSREAAVALLEQQHVGRIAFTFHDRVDIEPISYVYADGWIYARTSPGTKLTTVHHHPYVAFEIDDVRGRTDWRSVVVRGTIYFLDPERGAKEREEHDAAVGILHAADPDALTAHDSAPYRRQLFRIHADEITGREARAE